MKYLLSISLLTLFFLPQLLKIVIFMDFSVRQDTIAETICEQKDVPNNCCHGKCYLSAQFQKVDNSYPDYLPEQTKEKKHYPSLDKVLTHLLLSPVVAPNYEPLQWFFLTKYRPYFSSKSWIGYNFVPYLLKPPKVFS